MRNICYFLCFAFVGANLAGAQFPSGPRSPYLNVCHDTPLGNFPPKSDITKPLQWAIDHQRDGEGFKPYVPAGLYFYAQTLRIPSVEGGYLGGMGRGENNLAGAGLQTSLLYTGDASQPGVLYLGNNWTIENLAFLGRSVVDQRQGKPRQPLGILVTRERGRPGTTRLRLTDVGLWGWDTAIQNGENIDTSNCDMHIFTDLVCGDCGVGFYNRNRMGMHHTFTRPRFFADVGLKYEAGGTVYISDAGLGGSNNNKFLVLDGGKVGQASGGFYFDGFKIDGSVDGTGDACVVEMLQPATTRIVIDRLQVSNTNYQNNGGVLATIRGDSQLTIRDSYRPAKIVCHEQDQGPGRRTRRPQILVDNCWLAGGVLDIEGPHSLVVRDCIEWGRWEKDDDFTFSHVPNSVDSD